jgi:hypothetical protein
MAMPGRNDPCPCGSGKKFKKCCIDKYKTPTDPIERLRRRVDVEMEWASETYRQQAQHFLDHVNPEYGEEAIDASLYTSQQFSQKTKPTIQKFGAFSAAMEYEYASFTGWPVTLSDLAKKYDVLRFDRHATLQCLVRIP